jgi:hypothetical protein
LNWPSSSRSLPSGWPPGPSRYREAPGAAPARGRRDGHAEYGRAPPGPGVRHLLILGARRRHHSRGYCAWPARSALRGHPSSGSLRDAGLLLNSAGRKSSRGADGGPFGKSVRTLRGRCLVLAPPPAAVAARRLRPGRRRGSRCLRRAMGAEFGRARSPVVRPWPLGVNRDVTFRSPYPGRTSHG